jgi:putative membrane protein
MMIEYHTQSSNKLKPLAQQKGVTLPNSPSSEGRALVSQLSQLRGKQFDQAYMQGQAQAHTRTEADYRRQLQQGQDADVKAFANQVLPIVNEHRRMAEGMVAGR